MSLPGIRLLMVLLSLVLLNGGIARSWSQPPAAGAQRNAQQPAPPTPEQQALDRLLEAGNKARAETDFPAALKAFELGLEKAQALGDDLRTARFLNGIGGVYYSQGQFDKVLDYFNRALHLFEKQKNELGVAACLNNLGLVCYRMGQYEKAIDHLNQSLTLRQKLDDKQNIAACLNNLGLVYYNLAQYQKALDYHKQALTLRQQLNNPHDIAGSLNNLGMIYVRLSQYEKALDAYNQAQTLREKLPDQQDIAYGLDNLGEVYYNLGQYEKALHYHNQALIRYKKLDNKQDIATCLDNLGTVYRSMGQFEKAIDYGNQALDLRRNGNEQDIAASLNNLGNVYANVGQFEKALDYLNQALPLMEKVGNPQDTATSLDNLGNVYENLGQYEKALDYHNQALALREKLPNQQDIAQSLYGLGTIFTRLNQYEKALNNYTQALKLFEKSGNPQKIAVSLTGVGAAYYSLGQYAKAIDFDNQALAFRENLQNPQDIAAILNNLGIVYESLGQFKKALEYYNRALTLREQAGNELDIAQSLYSQSVIYLKQQQFAKAEPAFANTRKQFNNACEQITDPTQIGAFQQTLSHFYAAYALLRFQRHLPFDALALADSGRAQGLARQAAQSRTDLSHLFSTHDAQRWTQTNQEDTTAYSHLQAAQQRLNQANHQTDPQEKAAAQTQLDNARARTEQAERQLLLLRSDLYQRYPRFRQLKAAAPLDAARIQHLASQHPDTLFLHYDTVDDKTTLLFALSSTDGLHTFTLPVGDKALSTEAKEWRTALTAPAQLSDPNLSLVQRAALSPQVHRQMQEEPAAASMLYNALILPLDKAGLLRSDRYRHLVVVADGPLLDIPFAALRDQQGRRLIDRFPVAMSVSLGFLAWPTEQRTAQGSLFFAADPTGPKGQRLANQDGRLHLMGGGLGPLPVARAGAEEVAKLFPGALGVTGALATIGQVKSRMEQYALLLFATHGWLDESNGLRSWLLLAPEAGKSEAEGLLFAQEILGLRLSARLSVLMACQSGLGQVSGGEGLEGLVWAFWAAGCPSVVGSEWEVDEDATSHLMVAFYRGLRSGARKDEALRKAIQAVRKDPNWRYPYFWASFAVYGDTSALPASLTKAAGR